MISYHIENFRLKTYLSVYPIFVTGKSIFFITNIKETKFTLFPYIYNDKNKKK